MKNKFTVYIDQKGDALKEEVEKLKEEIRSRTREFAEKVHNTEVNTLWKIKDCEDLLKKRISEGMQIQLMNHFCLDYVNTAVRNSEERLKKEMRLHGEKQNERCERTTRDLTSKIKGYDSLIEEKDQKVRNSVCSLSSCRLRGFFDNLRESLL